MRVSWNAARLKGRAHGIVAQAIKKGLLARLDGSISCKDCDKTAQVYDHRDYKKPLAVEPVCRPCNHDRGPAKPTSF